MKKQILIIFMLALMLSACGFHTRLANNLSPRLKMLNISIDSKNTQSGLKKMLSESLTAAGIKLDSHAPVALIILSENFSQSFAVLGAAQQVNNVDLYYTAAYALKDAHTNIIIQQSQLTCHTSYLQNASQILADTAVIPSLQQELRRAMVSQILAHLASDNTRRALSA